MQKKLTRKDRKKIEQKIWATVAFIVFAIVLFTIIYRFVLSDFQKDSDGFGNIPVYIFGVFGLFFLGVVVYMISVFMSDLNGGMKNYFEGIVEDKNLNIVQSKSHGRSSFRGGRRSSRTSTKRYYHITVDGKQHKIEPAMYNNVKVGDTIYFEVAPKSKIILSYEVLEHAVARTSPRRAEKTKENYPTSKMRQSPLTRQDTANIQKYFYKNLQYRLSICLFISLPIIGLVANGLWVFTLFLFPLVIIVLYQLYKLIVLYINYKKTIVTGRKQLIETEVRDKIFTTVSNSKGKQAKRTLVTTYDTVEVPEPMYQQIETGTTITIHKALKLPYVMGITVNEQYYHF
jgi:hypothetical protein